MAAKTIAIASAVPVAFVSLLLIGAFAWWRQKRQSQEKSIPKSPQEISTISTSSQPYFQQKAELEDEERRRHELEGRSRVHELNKDGSVYQLGDNGPYELPVIHDIFNIPSLTEEIRQELRGEENSKELE